MRLRLRYVTDEAFQPFGFPNHHFVYSNFSVDRATTNLWNHRSRGAPSMTVSFLTQLRSLSEQAVQERGRACRSLARVYTFYGVAWQAHLQENIAQTRWWQIFLLSWNPFLRYRCELHSCTAASNAKEHKPGYACVMSIGRTSLRRM